MQTKIKNLGKLKRQMTVTIPEKEIEQVSYKVHQNLKNQLSIKGFRKGKFPKNLMEKRFQEDIEYEVKKKIIPEYLSKAIKEKSLKLAAQPKIDSDKIEKNKPFSFTVEFEVFPDFQLPIWKEIIKIKKQQNKINEKEIDNYLLLTILQNYDYKEKSAPIENTDKVELQLDFLEIAQKKEKKTITIVYYIGSKEISEELDKALLKMKKGEKKNLEFLVSPYSLSQDIAGKKIKIKIEILSIAKKIETAKNKEFFQKINPEITEEKKLREFCKKSLENMRQKQIENKEISEVRETIIKNIDFDVPEELIKTNVEQLQAQQEQKQQTAANLRKTAIDNIRFQFVLTKIIEEQKITVSNEELGKAITRIALSYNTQPAELLAGKYGKNLMDNIRHQLEEQKSLEFILKNAQRI